ncbi:hypothetical protein DVH24_014761 [Malus domestica]|uniref:Uncharacterized protein n=1 Tax=Malus domestica TaxID=3750 RepID=A0A498K7S5_MALDO|nr:hypothetical protein DVH24_014761 [Malus domestica]
MSRAIGRGVCTYKAHHPFFIGRCGILHSTPLKENLASSSAHSHQTTDLDSAVTRYCPLWMRTSQWVTHHRIALARTRLISEFRWNPKPVSS